MPTSSFQVTVGMSAATVGDLTASGYSLFAFAAVQASDETTQPLVWMKTQQYAQTTTVGGAMQFQAYTAPSAQPSGPVVPGFSADVALGETLTVQASGTSVTETGAAGAVTIANDTSDPLGCGISQMVSGAYAPVCLLPLYGNNGQVIVPVPSVLLMFSTSPVAAGTPVVTASGPGVLLDLGTMAQPNVSYDINLGWSWGEAAWGQGVAFGAPLQPLLAAAPPSLSDLALALWPQHGAAPGGAIRR